MYSYSTLCYTIIVIKRGLNLNTRKGELKMTVFEELTKGMKYSEPTEDIKKNMVKVFRKNFGCPPWNDEYEEGCASFAGCESCWFGYINSEAK